MMFIKRFVALLLCFSFTLTNSPSLWAQSFNINDLPVPGRLVAPVADFTPLTLKGLAVHPENVLRFDFIMDTGNSHLQSEPLKQEALKVMKYFLTALTIPQDDLWVNLSPYEKNRVIENNLGATIMGRDLLAEDYVLKQLTASLVYPEAGLGKKFWQEVYQKAHSTLGTTQIPVNTFNKVWIVPSQAVVWQHEGKVLIVKSHLKVMLEEDYLALKHNRSPPGSGFHALGNQIVRRIILPVVEKQVNEGKYFAPLRQMFQAMILATWYKKALRESIINKIYADQKKVKGLDTVKPGEGEAIYQRYTDAFRKGAVNYIKEDLDSVTGKVVPRKYFSGGFSLKNGLLTLATALSIWAGTLSPAQAADVHHAMIAAGTTILVKGSVQSSQDFAQTAQKFIAKSLKDPDLPDQWRKEYMLASAGGIATTIKALRDSRILELFKDPHHPGKFREITMLDIVKRIEQNSTLNTPHRGHLHQAMFYLAMMGWVKRLGDKTKPDDTMRFELTPKGQEAMQFIDYYAQVSEFMPDALDLKDYLDGKPPKDSSNRFSIDDLVHWVETSWKDFPSFENQALEREVKSQLWGFMLGPLITEMSKRKILRKFDDGDIKLLLKNLTDTEHRQLSEVARQRWQAAFDLLQVVGFVQQEGNRIHLTKLGAIAFSNALVWGVPVSYYPTYNHVPDLLAGNADVIWQTDADGNETHVDRVLNVRGSGFSHKKYFKDLHRATADVIERQMASSKIPTPDKVQPNKPYIFRIADTGSGDGMLLEELHRYITRQTAYGALMQKYPRLYKIEMIGIDLNKAARYETAKRLGEKNIPYKVLFGDINDPQKIAEDLKHFHNIDMKADINLHVRSFLDHNRPYIGVEDKEAAAKRQALSQGVFSDKEGNLIPNNFLEQNLKEHLERWREVVDELLVIELHNIPEEEAARNLATSVAVSYALSHGYSAQYIVEAAVFLAIAREAGFDVEQIASYPKAHKNGKPTGRSPAVTVSHFRSQSAVATAVNQAMTAMPVQDIVSSNRAIMQLQNALREVLSVYANVHRGTGGRSEATTELFEEARHQVLLYDGKDPQGSYTAILNNRRNTELLTAWLDHNKKFYRVLTSKEFGLNLGVEALIVRKQDLPDKPLAPGGGTVQASTEVEIRWADLPDRFEAGTPNIVGIILFGKALQMSRQEQNKDLFKSDRQVLTAQEMFELLNKDPFSGINGEKLLEKTQGTFYTTDDGVYLDHGASNMTFGLVGEVMDELLSKTVGPQARQELVTETETNLRRLVHAPSEAYNVIFTGNTTDASNILALNVIQNIKRLKSKGRKIAILGSQLEHNSSRLPYIFNRYLAGEDESLREVEYLSLSIDDKGFFDLEEFERILREHNAKDAQRAFIPFMQISAASNVFGSLNNIKRMIEIAHDYGVMVAIDGAQLLAHAQIDMIQMDPDFMLFSGHKAYAPGAGALLIRKNRVLDWEGFAASELDYFKSVGTENLVGLAAWARSLYILNRIGMDVVVAHEQRVAKDLIEKLKEFGPDIIHVYGETRDLSRRAGVITATFRGYPVDLVGHWLAQDANIMSRQGCFCSATAVFQGVGYDVEAIEGLINKVGGEDLKTVGPRMLRFSIGLNNTEEDNNRVIASLRKLFVKTQPNQLEQALASIHAQSPPPGPLTEELAQKYADIFKVGRETIRLWDQGPRLLAQMRKGAFDTVTFAEGAKARVFAKDKAQVTNPIQRQGGIDFTKPSLEAQGQDIRFSIDPAQLAQLQNTPGFVPIIISIQPLRDIHLFFIS